MSFIKNEENIERQLHKKKPKIADLNLFLQYKIDLSIPIS